MQAKSWRRVLRLIVGRLFGAKTPNITRLNHKELYFRNYYFPENICKGIKTVAEFERVSKKKAAQLRYEKLIDHQN